MFMTFLGIIVFLFVVIALTFVLFMMDELFLKGYFATKLRKRFNVEDLK